MERLNLNQEDVERNRDTLREPEAASEQPCPGSHLKHDDDIQWLGFVNGRVLWGHPHPQTFYAYAPEIFGDAPVPLDIGYVNDRAPADPEETPMPLYPEEPPQQFAQQPGVADAAKKKKPKKPDAEETKRILQELLKQIPPDAAKKARAYIREHKSEIKLPEE